jgi:hypothetical protein
MMSMTVYVCPNDGSQLVPAWGDDFFEWACQVCPYGTSAADPIEVEVIPRTVADEFAAAVEYELGAILGRAVLEGEEIALALAKYRQSVPFERALEPKEEEVS